MGWIDEEFEDLDGLPILFVQSVAGDIEFMAMNNDGCSLFNGCKLDGYMTCMVR